MPTTIMPVGSATCNISAMRVMSMFCFLYSQVSTSTPYMRT